MKTTKHKTSSGLSLTFKGEHLFDVVATADDGQEFATTVAADDEWKARTRCMAVSDMKLCGQTVSYVVKMRRPLGSEVRAMRREFGWKP